MLVRDWVLEPNVSLRLGFVKTASDFKNPILPTLGFQKPNLEGPTTTKISQNRKSTTEQRRAAAICIQVKRRIGTGVKELSAHHD